MLDDKLILSEAQAETTVAEHISEHVTNVGTQETALGEEENLRLRVSVDTKCESGGAATVVVTAYHHTTATVTSGTAFYTGPAIALATMKKGYLFCDIGLPTVHGQYIGISYTIAGAALTAGKFNAYIHCR